MSTQQPAQAGPAKPSCTAGHSKLLQRKCVCGGTADSTGECEECRKKSEGGALQRAAIHPSPFRPAPTKVPASVHHVLSSPGQPLDSSTRAFMEPRFRHNFGSVRVHADLSAARTAQDVGAHAYAVGSQIVFGEGQYRPETVSGRQLIAHELTHVARNRTSHGGLEIGEPDGPEERVADQIAENVIRGRSDHLQQGMAPDFALRRQPAAGVEGWSGATGPNKSETTKSGIRRIPLDKLSVGHQTGSSPSGKAIVLLPPALNSAQPVDVLLHFHGHNAGYEEAGGGVRDVSIDNMEGQLASSGRTQMIGILPQGDANSSFGENPSLGGKPSDQKFFNSDSYVDAVLGTLLAVGAIKQKPVIGNVVITGHSGAGELINEKLLGGASGSELPKTLGTLKEIALFDAVNGPKEYEALKGFLRKKLQQELDALTALRGDTERRNFLGHSFRLRAYFSHPNGDPNYYAKWHIGPVPTAKGISDAVPLDKVIADFFSQKAVPALGAASPVVSAFRANYLIFDAGKQVKHDEMVAEQDHLKESLKVLPKLEPGARDVPAFAPPSVHEALRSSHRPLEEPIRAWAEARFRRDLGGVRVHNNAEAANSAIAVQARAFTVGHHVVFGSNQYEPSTARGRQLLAHELAHVVQQRALERSPRPIPEKLSLGVPGDFWEQEADRAAVQGCFSDAGTAPVRLQRQSKTVDAAVCETNANPNAAQVGTCNYKEPEHCLTYESWIGTFTLLKTFEAFDTPGKSKTGFDVIGLEAADRNFGKPSNPPKTAVPPATPLKPGERFIDRPTDDWVKTCLPSNLRVTAYQLPADCADVAIILRHVWLAAHHRTEKFGKYVLGDAAGRSSSKGVLDIISNVGTASIATLVAPYSDAQGKPLRSFAALQPLLHPGDILVWWHYDKGFDKAHTGGHTHTISGVDRDSSGKIKLLNLLQGNEPLFAPQKTEIHDFLKKEKPGAPQPSDKELGEAPGRRIERSTSDQSVLSFTDITLKQGEETLKIWKWGSETLLVAAGPPKTAARPTPVAQKGEPGKLARRLTDWIPALKSAEADQLDGTLEGVIYELRSTVEGGGSVLENDVRAVAAAGGNRVWKIAKDTKDLGNESHFQRLQHFLDMLWTFENSRSLAMSRKLDSPYDLMTDAWLKHIHWFRDSFELAARGAADIQFSQGTPKGESVNVVLTGFDPFEPSGSLRPPDPGQWNPSAAAVLALDQQRLPVNGSKGLPGTAAVEGIVLPVSFDKFRGGIVEQAIGSHLTELDALLTVSMDSGREPDRPIRLERYAVGVHQVGSKLEGVLAAGGAIGPTIIESPAPLQQIAAETKTAPKGTEPGIAQPEIGEEITFLFPSAAEADNALKTLSLRPQGTPEVKVSSASALKQILATMTKVGNGPDIRFVTGGKTFRATVVEGPGGNFLSNEVSYRALRLLENSGSLKDPLSFHVHTPSGGAIPQDTSTPAARKARAEAQRAAMGLRQTLIQTLKRVIAVVAGLILDRRAAKSPKTPSSNSKTR